MKVAVTATTHRGTNVHGIGCADIAKDEKRFGDNAWIMDVQSKVELSHIYWNDVMSDTVEDVDGPEGWATAEAWLGEFNFLPCASALPHDHREEATETTEEAPATAVSTWVGKAIAARIMDTTNGTIAEKLRAAKVTKAGDRTIKLTAEEAEVLAADCTEMEALGGSLAYSARTLRARIS